MKEIKKLISKTTSGYKLNLSYFDSNTSYHFNDNIKLLLGNPYNENDKIDQRMTDIACSMQLVFEDVVMHLLNILRKKTDIDNLVLSGGCALNSKANGKIQNNKVFKNIYIPPAPGDSGVALGAAYLETFTKTNFEISKLSSDYLGPEYSVPAKGCEGIK